MAKRTVKEPVAKKKRTVKRAVNPKKSVAMKGNKNAIGNEGGRPTVYKKEYCEQVFKLCLLGADDSEIADFFRVTETTVNNWKKKHTEFFESIRDGKEKADLEIVNSLYQRAKGVTVKTQKAIKIKISRFEEDVKIVEVEESLPPDQRSIEFWLKNRKGKKWKAQNNVDITSNGKSINSLAIPDNDEEMLKEIDRLKKIIE